MGCGLSKEFLLEFWNLLGPVVTGAINKIWTSQCMDSSFKLGIIKLLPKKVFPSSLVDWRPITMMGLFYKLMGKAIAIKISSFLKKHVHVVQSGFIARRFIFDNIITVMLGVEASQKSNQKVVLLQLDFAKAFDNVLLDLVVKVMEKLGFGLRIAYCILSLASRAASRILSNGRLSKAVPINRSVKQGCSLRPLLFVVATHPIFCFLKHQADNGSVLGLEMNQEQIVALGFANDTLAFLEASNANAGKCMSYLSLFSLAAGLDLNLGKSTLIDVTSENFHSLVWRGKRVCRGTIFRHLGYLVGVDVTNKQLTDCGGGCY
ncbi:hypothetical protein L7F22_037754 [Adiantum nelumboides]|nr:hypothetical protein [Adiantum nelumboides]